MEVEYWSTPKEENSKISEWPSPSQNAKESIDPSRTAPLGIGVTHTMRFVGAVRAMTIGVI
jgi:hypothetical protein